MKDIYKIGKQDSVDMKVKDEGGVVLMIRVMVFYPVLILFCILLKSFYYNYREKGLELIFN